MTTSQQATTRQGTAGTPRARMRARWQWLQARLDGEDTVAQFLRFALVGGASTALYGALLIMLQDAGTQPANLIGSLASSVLATELHRRLTFRVGAQISWITAQWQGAGLSLAGMVATSLALSWFDAAAGHTNAATSLFLVTAVTGAVGLLRFLALRWSFTIRPA